MEGTWEAERRKEARGRHGRGKLQGGGLGVRVEERNWEKRGRRRVGGEGIGPRPSSNGVMHSFWWSCKFHDANCTSVYLRGDLRQPVGGQNELRKKLSVVKKKVR